MKLPTTTSGNWRANRVRTGATALLAQLAAVLTARRILIALVLIGIGLRLWLIAINPIDPASSTADDGDYYRRALRLAITGQYIDDSWLIRPPGHVALFALGLRAGVLAGDLDLGLRLIRLAQVGLSAVQIGLGYAVARRLFGTKSAGLLFAAFLALWYPFVEQPSLLFSELLYGTLFMAHLWLLLRFDANRRWHELALSGVCLGCAALTRSPALYSLAFVAVWLAVRWWQPGLRAGGQRSGSRDAVWRPLAQLLVITVGCLAIVLPWTLRNYVVYQRVIAIDTLGQTNLWLDLEEPALRNGKIEQLRALPQADRAGFAMKQARAILARDPLSLVRNAWPHFRHIWKLPFVEDYYLRESFYDRPLRQAAALGIFGDALWLVLIAAGVAGLAAPVREGWHNRLFILMWLAYTLFTVIVFHVEPRYLLPLWTLIALYGAGFLTRRPTGERRIGAILPILALVAFVALLLTYRDYPAIIRQGEAREQAMRTGDAAFARADYHAAEYAYAVAQAAQPSFQDATVQRALAQLAQGQREQAAATVANEQRRTAWLVGLVASGGASDQVADLNYAEATTGLDIQQWALDWTRPAPSRTVHLGAGRDIGAISGFSAAEADGQTGSFRWMRGRGRVRLTLPAPLAASSSLALRLAAPQPTKITIEIAGVRQTLPVATGVWRTYIVQLPAAASGLQTLDIGLRAPTFIPAQRDPATNDLRELSVMVSDVYLR